MQTSSRLLHHPGGLHQQRIWSPSWRRVVSTSTSRRLNRRGNASGQAAASSQNNSLETNPTNSLYNKGLVKRLDFGAGPKLLL
ncbi:hypothetical protein E3U43_021514 [Larimichthys crocea]|uniref:Uncharacterized protein n=1 Tax=Larimichthys crocea TaxID=215358 RepID=A0ACD3R649_LARCR|nr:hypothetical protein E3U43_021514 [Larimichthys crocea]